MKYTAEALAGGRGALGTSTSTTGVLPGQGDRRDRRGGRARPAARRGASAPTRSTARDVERSSRRWRRSRRKTVSASDKAQLRNLEPRAQGGHLRPGPGDRASCRSAIKLSRSGLAHAGEADRLVPLLRPHRRRQDRARQAAREGARRRVPPLRHERVHGEAHRLAADRRAAGLRRLRPGRAAHRRDPQDTRTPCWCSTRSRRRTRTSSTSCSR